MTTLIRQIPVFVFQNLCVCVLLLLEFNLDNPSEASCTYSSDLLSPASAQLLGCSGQPPCQLPRCCSSCSVITSRSSRLGMSTHWAAIRKIDIKREKTSSGLWAAQPLIAAVATSAQCSVITLLWSRLHCLRVGVIARASTRKLNKVTLKRRNSLRQLLV